MRRGGSIRLRGGVLAAVLVTVFFGTAGMALAETNRWAFQYQPSSANERWGVRGWLMGTNPNIPSDHLDDRCVNVTLWLRAEMSGTQPWVEIGFFSGVAQSTSPPYTNQPTLYKAYNTTGLDADYDERAWGTIGIGSLHKVAFQRTDHNTEGETRWDFYFDGDNLTHNWLPAPDLGHAEAGGEIYTFDGTWPSMLAKARDNGSGEANRMCIHVASGSWTEWNTSYTTATQESTGTAFDAFAPKWSNFNATDD